MSTTNTINTEGKVYHHTIGYLAISTISTEGKRYHLTIGNALWQTYLIFTDNNCGKDHAMLFGRCEFFVVMHFYLRYKTHMRGKCRSLLHVFLFISNSIFQLSFKLLTDFVSFSLKVAYKLLSCSMKAQPWQYAKNAFLHTCYRFGDPQNKHAVFQTCLHSYSTYSNNYIE